MREKLMDILMDIEEEIINYQGNNLLEDGLLDSIQLLDLVEEIEDAFDIHIDADQMVRENFKTVDTILRLVQTISESRE